MGILLTDRVHVVDISGAECEFFYPTASRRVASRLFVCVLLTFYGIGNAEAGDRYAFLVGVKQYDKTQLTSLQYTEADVTALAEALKKAGYADANIVLMTQARGATNFRQIPASQQIRKELELMLGELRADDTLLLAFSGHGVQFKDEANVYFCPIDANLKNRSTLISLTDLYATLSDVTKCKAQTKVLLVDACRNDPQSKLSKADREIELNRRECLSSRNRRAEWRRSSVVREERSRMSIQIWVTECLPII